MSESSKHIQGIPAGKAPVTSDYFAELYVAGRLADAGWNIYFPHRDQGFDFIITKYSLGAPTIRPVQVKGKYPTKEKGDANVYGYVGKLSELHDEMVLAIPFFSSKSPSEPECVAYMPRNLIIPGGRGYRCMPASYKDGISKPRRDYAKFFNEKGIAALEKIEWSRATTGGTWML